MQSEERTTMDVGLAGNLDLMLLDIVMHSNSELTQEALNLLMVHSSQQRLYLKTAKRIQIIYASKMEATYRNLNIYLRELQRLAEMFEIWCELKTKEDMASAEQVLDILSKIKQNIIIRNDDRTLDMKSLVLVDEEVQTLLRNLNAMPTLMTLIETLHIGAQPCSTAQRDEHITRIMRSCNDLICYFVKSSPTNQAIAFENVDWFIDRMDDGIDSLKVTRTHTRIHTRIHTLTLSYTPSSSY